MTKDGFQILEGNNYTDVNLLQVHAPLLRDERILSFYQRHGVIWIPPGYPSDSKRSTSTSRDRFSSEPSGSAARARLK